MKVVLQNNVLTFSDESGTVSIRVVGEDITVSIKKGGDLQSLLDCIGKSRTHRICDKVLSKFGKPLDQDTSSSLPDDRGFIMDKYYGGIGLGYYQYKGQGIFREVATGEEKLLASSLHSKLSLL